MFLSISRLTTRVQQYHNVFWASRYCCNVPWPQSLIRRKNPHHSDSKEHEHPKKNENVTRYIQVHMFDNCRDVHHSSLETFHAFLAFQAIFCKTQAKSMRGSTYKPLTNTRSSRYTEDNQSVSSLYLITPDELPK